MSRTTTIADAVAASINAGPLDGVAVASRVTTPTFDFKGTAEDAVVVQVLDGLQESRPLSRGSREIDVVVQVGVQAKVDHGDKVEVDSLKGVVESIDDHLHGLELGGAFWVNSDTSPLADQEHLEKIGLFTSVLSVTFRDHHTE